MQNDARFVEGGESILVDVMAAAYVFRTMASYFFDVLCNCCVTFVKERDGALMTYSRPHIQIQKHYYGDWKNEDKVTNDGSDKGDVNANGIGRNYYEEIVSVHWAPPFEGPQHIAPDLLEAYYQAYSAFELMVDNTIDVKQRILEADIDADLAMALSKYARDYTWKYKLKPGEMIIFNNTRMLHGRREFELKATFTDDDCNESSIDGQNNYDDDDENKDEIESKSVENKRQNICKKSRHLIGAYTNIDDSLNKYRVMLKEGKVSNRNIPNVGNGTGSVLP